MGKVLKTRINESVYLGKGDFHGFKEMLKYNYASTNNWKNTLNNKP